MCAAGEKKASVDGKGSSLVFSSLNSAWGNDDEGTRKKRIDGSAMRRRWFFFFTPTPSPAFQVPLCATPVDHPRGMVPSRSSSLNMTYTYKLPFGKKMAPGRRIFLLFSPATMTTAIVPGHTGIVECAQCSSGKGYKNENRTDRRPHRRQTL